MNKKITKFINSSNDDKKKYIKKIIIKINIYLTPKFKIFLIPFISNKSKRNVFLDFLEGITNLGPLIRYRYYLGFKLFYSCSKNGTGIINHITNNRIYEKETCDILEETLRNIKEPCFIDVGANIGLISLFMLNKYPKIKIFAFEPSPHQHSLLKRTIEENNISNSIKLTNSALSDTQGEISFFVHDEANCSGDGISDTGRGGAGNFIKVNTTTLDTWSKENNISRIDLIKIDTEGAELLVLKGGIETLRKYSPTIFFEMQESNYKGYNYTWKDFLFFFESINYSIYTESGEKLDTHNTKNIMSHNYNFIAKNN